MLDIKRTIEEINKLPLDDRLYIIGEIWDGLPRDAGAIPMSPEQQAELDRRNDEYEKNPDDGLTWEEFLERLDDKFK